MDENEKSPMNATLHTPEIEGGGTISMTTTPPPRPLWIKAAEPSDDISCEKDLNPLVSSSIMQSFSCVPFAQGHEHNISNHGSSMNEEYII
jgi:hypothetical protein